MFKRDGDFWNTPLGACADLRKRTGIKINPRSKDVAELLAHHGYVHHRPEMQRFFRRQVVRVNKEIARFLRRVGSWEKYFR